MSPCCSTAVLSVKPFSQPAIVGHLVVEDWLRWVVPVYVLSFGPSLLFSLAYWRRADDISLVRAFAMAHLLSVYNYVWYLATWKAVGRAALGRRAWAKTARVEDEPDDDLVDAA